MDITLTGHIGRQAVRGGGGVRRDLIMIQIIEVVVGEIRAGVPWSIRRRHGVYWLLHGDGWPWLNVLGEVDSRLISSLMLLHVRLSATWKRCLNEDVK